MNNSNRGSSKPPPAVSPGEADTGAEFEFSRLMVGEPVPFDVSKASVERTWARLSRAHGGSSSSFQPASRGRWAGPVVALAASAAAFVAGVWVGADHSTSGPLHVLSAERSDGVVLAGPDSNSSSAVSRRPLGHALPNGRHNFGVADAVAGGDGAPWLDSAVDSPAVGSHPAVGLVGPNPRARRGSSRPNAYEPTVPVPSFNPTTEASARVDSISSASVDLPQPATWQRLASGGDYEAALIEITQAGGFERVLGLASAEQLMLLSDVARASGQQQRALAALRRIVSEHPSDPVAPLAALNMGNLLDKMGDGAGATEAFAVYRALSPRGDFAEDALVRQLRSAVSAGKQELARRLVGQYETDFPEGRRSDEVSRLAEQISIHEGSADAGAARFSP